MPALLIVIIVAVIVAKLTYHPKEIQWVEYKEEDFLAAEPEVKPGSLLVGSFDADENDGSGFTVIDKLDPNGEYSERKQLVVPDGTKEDPDAEYTVSCDDLVAWVQRAYDEEWEYVYGGCSVGQVDCSGLIKSCVDICARGTEEQFAESPLSGDISTLPEIPGLGVYYKGHVGVYVGDGKVIDARGESVGIGFDDVDYEGWTHWYEIKGVNYAKYGMYSD